MDKLNVLFVTAYNSVWLSNAKLESTENWIFFFFFFLISFFLNIFLYLLIYVDEKMLLESLNIPLSIRYDEK